MKVRYIPGMHRRKKLRVAAYCRVSTDRTEQEESFATQIAYYTALIESTPEWGLAQIYAEEGRSATNVRGRPQFLRMIEDAMDGKIDLILTKSISRFSRNVVDCQSYVGKLRSKGVEVRFERERLSTLAPSMEMVFSIMAAVAQDESRSISENIKWGYRRRAARGIHRIGNNKVLGYDEVEGVLTPNRDAWIIRMAFDLFVRGMSYAQIARQITRAGGRRLRGNTPLDGTSIRRIVSNEIFVGDRLLQKQAPVNYLTKRREAEGSYQSWYWTDTHEGIIDRQTWNAAQEMLRSRSRKAD